MVYRRTFLLHINTLAYAKAEMASAQEFTLLIHCAESPRRITIFALQAKQQSFGFQDIAINLNC